MAIDGCGVIVCFLNDPYQEYSYETASTQWLEHFRDCDHYYIDRIDQIGPFKIIVYGEFFDGVTSDFDFKAVLEFSDANHK